MILRAMQVNNFLGIGSATMRFDKTGLTLIEGVNHDSATASSNGAGKSSIFEAVYWVLYGKTKRGLTGDDVINITEGKDCFVAMTFDDYHIERHRKLSPDNTSGLILHRLTDDGKWRNITKGTVKDTQELLESIIKISELTFSKIAYFGQEDVKAFASLTDAELKQVFEQALGVTIFSKYADIVKQHKNTLERKGVEVATGIKVTEGEVANINEKIEYLTKAIAELKAKYKEERDRAYKELDALQVEIEELAKATCITDSDYSLKMNEIKEKNEKYSELLALQVKLGHKHREEIEVMARQKYALELKQKEYSQCNKEILQANDKVGKNCGECGKAYKEEDIAGALKSLQKKLCDLTAEVAQGKIVATEQAATIAKLKKLEEGLAAKLEVLKEVATEKVRLEAEKAKSDANAKTIKGLKDKHTDKKTLIRTLGEKMATDPYHENITYEMEKLREKKAQIDELTKQLDELKLELEGAEMLCEIMGNGGLKSYIFDSITPELNKIISEYMTILNSDISVEISTVSKLKSKKDEYREKFNIKVSNANGASQYEGSSSGEKQLINLAIALGFNSIVRAMAEGSVNTLWLDEPLENLDEASAEKAIELCEKFVGKVPNTFIISHSPAVRDLVANRITIEKRGGKAKVTA
jgi:DNA repair exonuclease SbcCD ATPase subunit